MSELMKERVLLVLALLLCIAVCLLAVVDAPDLTPVGILYTTTSPQSSSSWTAADGFTSNLSTSYAISTTGHAGSTAVVTTAAPSSTGKININTASKDTLMLLDGIGPTLAQRIIEYRDLHGGFSSIEEICEVPGIGDKRFAAIKDKICC